LCALPEWHESGTPHRRLFAAGIVAASFVSPAAAAPPSSTPSESSIDAEFPPVADASRIIPVNGDLAEVVFALGLGDHVVATDISATYPPAAADTPKIGYQRTLAAETILSFDPTVVLADDRAGPVEVLDQLREVGVDVVVIEHRTDIDSPSYKIRAVASALDAVDAGERLVDEFEHELDDGRDVAATGVASNGRPLVLALYLRGGAVQLAFGRGSGIDAVVEAAGGVNAGSEMGIDDFAELSIEAMVEAAPEYLLVTTSGLESVGGLEGLAAIAGIAETPAGRAGNVLVFEDQFLYGLGPRTGELVAELAAQLHPPAD
jgi:iron complex transport system substrate-binding protein